MKTLSLEASKLLHDKGIEVESEKLWVKGVLKCGYEGYRSIQEIDSDEWFVLDCIGGCDIDDLDFTPAGGDTMSKDEEEVAIQRMKKNVFHAPNLQELLDALPAIGEELGVLGMSRREVKKGEYFEAKFLDGKCIENEHIITFEKYHAHKILDKYLKEGMEGVSEYIIGLFE